MIVVMPNGQASNRALDVAQRWLGPELIIEATRTG